VHETTITEAAAARDGDGTDASGSPPNLRQPQAAMWAALFLGAFRPMFDVLDFLGVVEDHSIGFGAAVLSAVGALVAVKLVVRAIRRGMRTAFDRRATAVSVGVLVVCAVVGTTYVLTGPMGYRTGALGFTSDGVTITPVSQVPRCGAEVTVQAADGAGQVWVAHREVRSDRWYLTRAQQQSEVSTAWTAKIPELGSLREDGGVEPGLVYEFVAFSADGSADAFLAGRGYTDDAPTEIGLVHFGELPPGVSARDNRMTATRLADAGGLCPPA
jgi:hypothetical protein